MALRVAGHRAADVGEARARRSASVDEAAAVLAMERGERSVLGMVWRCDGGRDVAAVLPQQQAGALHTSSNFMDGAFGLWDVHGMDRGMDGRMALSWLAGR